MDTSSDHGAQAPRILLLSGTSEGPLLARALLAAGCAVHATVTRAEAVASLFGSLLTSAQPRLRVEACGFTEDSLADFLRAGRANLVVDATHPFAVRITQLTKRACARVDVPLVRYLRPDWTPPAGCLFEDSFAAAAARLPGLGQRIMLTIGAKQLKHFAHLHDGLTLFARVLPGEVSLQQARAAGFLPERIIQQRPPFTQAENRALFEKLGVDVLLTKASGREGGVAEKVLAALDLGMSVLMIRRPDDGSSDTVDTCAAVIDRIRAHFSTV